jgi:hypothetical protein
LQYCFFRLLLEVSHNDPSHPPVIIFAHSQGAIISNAALQLLTFDERQRLRIFTFGGGSFIFPENSHPDTHNYISIGDFVPRLAASATLALLAIRRYEENKRGLSDDQIIDGLINEDIDNNLATTDPPNLTRLHILQFWMRRDKVYGNTQSVFLAIRRKLKQK